MWEKSVLFIDAEALVIDKPAGLAVHPGPRTRESLEDILHHFRFGFQREPMIVHRLDRDTSGCLLLARNPRVRRRMQTAFEGREVRKTYLAVVEGVPEAEAGTIDLPLAKISSAEQGWRMVVDPNGKSAVSHWQRIATHEGRALIRFEPETGRTHQIRVHAREGLGFPIVGDPHYGRGGGPMMLHARALHLGRPGKRPIEAVAPLPEHFVAAGFGEAELETDNVSG